VARALSGQPVLAQDGTPLDIRFDSVCVHSDVASAPGVAAAIRTVIDSRR
jgi:UPF0271 protein